MISRRDFLKFGSALLTSLGVSELAPARVDHYQKEKGDKHVLSIIANVNLATVKEFFGVWLGKVNSEPFLNAEKGCVLFQSLLIMPIYQDISTDIHSECSFAGECAKTDLCVEMLFTFIEKDHSWNLGFFPGFAPYPAMDFNELFKRGFDVYRQWQKPEEGHSC
jgi:hypothetical protein